MSTREKIIKDLEEVWRFYEGDKLSIIEFLRSQHKEDYYTGDRSVKRKEEADKIEAKLNSKKASIEKIKRNIKKRVA